MDFNFAKTNLTKVSSSGSAILSLSEYMDTAISKWERIVAGDTSISQISIPVTRIVDGVEKECAAVVNTDELRSALNEETNEVKAYIDEQMDYITLTADEVQSRIEDQISDFQVQSEFIKTCVSSVDANAEEFIAATKAKYAAVSSAKIAQYADLLKTNDKIGALKAWVSQIHVNQVTVAQDGTIELIDREKYTGVSVWSVLIQDFFSTIQGFFDKLWQGIQDIGGFFQRLWNGIVKLGQFILYKAFGQLSTNFTAGDSKIGILDFPLLQVNVGDIPSMTLSESTRYLSDSAFRDLFASGHAYQTVLKSGLENRLVTFIESNVDFYGHKINPDWYQRSTPEIISDIVANDLLVIQRDPDDVRDGVQAITAYSFKAVDVLIPSNDYADIVSGYVIRIGVTADRQVVISLYVSLNQSVKDGRTDSQLYSWIHINFWTTLIPYLYTQMHLPVVTNYAWSGDADCKVLDSSYCRDALLSPLTSAEESDSGPLDFAAHVKKLRWSDFTFDNPVSSGSALTYDDGVLWFICYGLLPYYCIFGPISDTPVVTVVESGMRKLTYGVKRLTGWYSDYWVDNDPLISEPYIPWNWPSEYKPYLSYNITPSSIHYQTISERAQEIQWVIISAIIAVAAVAAAVIVHKFKKKLNINAEIARGQCDNFAWNMDPTNPQDRQQYIKLRKKARKAERWQRLFGNASDMVAESNISKASDDASGVSSSGIDEVYKVIVG